ncbi:unnamed protein product, partial [marine sediment metagenome]
RTLEIRTLEITGAADAGGGDFVITIDSSAVTVTVAASDTIAEVTAAIVAKAADFLNAGRGWEVHTDDNISVEFISLVSENAQGTFSFVDTDSGVTAGTFEQATTTVEGATPTNAWTAQTSWNLNTMPAIDPTKLNVFKIQYQYLGAGAITYAIEDSDSGKLIDVHRIAYANTVTTASLRNPTLHMTMIAKTESGYSGGALSMKTASLAGFIEGDETLKGVRFSATGTKTTTGTTPVNVLTVHSELDFQGSFNKISAYPDFLTIASEQTKTVTILICVNPTRVDGAVALTAVDAARG